MNHRATLRFYAELRDFLPNEHPSATVTREFGPPGSVKDMIEACGVPHTEVDLIVVNGEPVAFDYQVRDGDRISVYPVFESFDISTIVKVRPEPLRQTSFVADAHLGRLARFLRLIGFDTLYDPAWDDTELAEISSRQRRILITRDVGLLKRSLVTHGYFVRATDPRRQIVEVAQRFHLEDDMSPFTRCMACNGELFAVDKEDVAERIPSATKQHIDEYRRCSGCKKIYWRGSHHPDLTEIIEAVKEDSNPGPGEG